MQRRWNKCSKQRRWQIVLPMESNRSKSCLRKEKDMQVTAPHLAHQPIHKQCADEWRRDDLKFVLSPRQFRPFHLEDMVHALGASRKRLNKDGVASNAMIA